MRKTKLSLSQADEATLLSQLAKGAFRVASYCDGVPFPGGQALLVRLDALVERGWAKLVERRGDRKTEWGDVWSVYEITPLGRRASEALPHVRASDAAPPNENEPGPPAS